MKAILESEDYIVDVAEGGQFAFEYLTHTIPDGIILDLMMPEVDGFQVLKKIRSTESTAKIPILILTAKDLTMVDFKMLNENNVKQLIQKGDVNREKLLLNISLMFKQKSKSNGEDSNYSNIEETIKNPKVLKNNPTSGKDKQDIPTILIIEDNPDNMITIKAVLGDKYNILEAENGEAGLEMALEYLPDLILLDMALPRMDGFEVIHRLKKDEKGCHIPIIAITALAMKGDKERILDAGCKDYISKPIDPESTLRKVEKFLIGGKNDRG